MLADAAAGNAAKRMHYKAAFLIQAIVFSDLLSFDADLREALVRAVEMCLPQSISKCISDVVLDPHTFALPSVGTLSRWRFLLDAGLCLHLQQQNRKCQHVKYLMVDSSTQGGKDYELMLVSQIDLRSVPRLLQDANALIELRCGATETPELPLLPPACACIVILCVTHTHTHTQRVGLFVLSLLGSENGDGIARGCPGWVT